MPECNDAERDLIRGRAEPVPRTPADKRFSAVETAITTAAVVSGAAGHEGIRTDPPGAHGQAGPPPGALVFSLLLWVGALVSSLTLWALCLAAACVSFGWYFYPTWQPKYLLDVHGISYEGSEIITGLPFLFGAAGALAGGWLSDKLVRATGSRRWGRSLLGVGGFSAAGLCVLASGFVRAPWQAVALLCLASLANDLAIPVIWAVCADVGGQFSATVAGIMNTVGGIGGMLSPALIPRALEALPPHYSATMRWQVIFAGLSLAWFIGAAAWLLIDAGKPIFKTK